jgi:hypothetical protein
MALITSLGYLPFEASKKTTFLLNKINWIMLCKELIAVYSENHKKLINAVCRQNTELFISKSCDTYSYQWTLKGLEETL